MASWMLELFLLLASINATLLHVRDAVALPNASSPFNPHANDNLIVYFGHSTGNEDASLIAVCNDTSVNVVNIGFIRQFNGPGIAPTVDFGGSCNFPNNFPEYCQKLAQQVQACQSLGKKIFISIGGSSSQTSFNSVQAAEDAANVTWNVFGGGSGMSYFRPFGDLTVDGFDIDHEDGVSTYYDDFAVALRGYFASSSHRYFLSVAPLCTNATASSTAYNWQFYLQMDFVNPQFYNAIPCNVNGNGFIDSFLKWYDFVGALQKHTGRDFPKISLGILSFNNSNSGYIPASQAAKAISWVRKHACKQLLEGTMLWDGTYGLNLSDYMGLNFNDATKKAMESVALSC